MHSVEKLFAIVDRKVDAFDFAIKKVKGKNTGNEYYAVSGVCIINGQTFEKRVLTIGCPKGAIEAIVRAILNRLGTTILSSIDEEVPVLKRIETPSITLSVHEDAADVAIPGLRKLTPVATSAMEEVDEDDYDSYDDDEYDEDDECDEDDDYCCDCTCECEESTAAPRVTLTPVREGPQDCPYCGAKVAPNFAYCPMCGGKQ